MQQHVNNTGNVMTPRNSSVPNRLYYSLSEATKALKAWGKTISIKDLLHYGVQGKVRFFIHVPSGIRVRRITMPLTYPDPYPSILILSKFHCGEIECNSRTEQSDFPNSYASIYSLFEDPLYVKNIHNIESMQWQTIYSVDKIARIPITQKTIFISHTDLNQLNKLIEYANRPLVEFSPGIDEQLQQEVDLRCYSFEDALKIAREKFDGFTESDLLRYGYYEKLSFLTPRPANMDISIVEAESTPRQNYNAALRPDMLALDPDDCYRIEIFGQTKRLDYRTGFLCKFKTLIPHPPSDSPDSFIEDSIKENSLSLTNYRLRVKVVETNLRWRTYHDSSAFPLEIRKDNIYVIRSEFDPLIDAASKSRDTPIDQIEYTPRFTIPEITKYRLSPKKFATLSEAAKLAKYSEAQLLQMVPLTFLTPVPCEIALCQAKQPVSDLEALQRPQTSRPADVEKIPQLLVLDHEDCKAVAAHGQHKQKVFKRGYSFENNELVLRTPYYPSGIVDSSQERTQQTISASSETHVLGIGVWLTFYQDKPIEIEITCDRIFVDLTLLMPGIQIEEDRNRLLYSDTAKIIMGALSKPESEGSSKESAITDIDTSKAESSFAATNPVSADIPEEIVTIKQFMEMANISRSTLNNKTQSGKYNDPEFPKKHKNPKNNQVHFLMTEVDAWIGKNPPRRN